MYIQQGCEYVRYSYARVWPSYAYNGTFLYVRKMRFAFCRIVRVPLPTLISVVYFEKNFSDSFDNPIQFVRIRGVQPVFSKTS
jgi:hypothetical protein